MEGYPEFLENFKSIKIILPLSTGTLKPYCDFPLKQLDSSELDSKDEGKVLLAADHIFKEMFGKEGGRRTVIFWEGNYAKKSTW